MTPEQCLDAHRKLAGKTHRTPWAGAFAESMEAAGLHLETRSFEVADEAWAALQEAAPRAGWLQCQSHQQAFFDGLPARDAAWGVPLAAEAVVYEDETLRLRFDGRWHLTRCRHLPEGDYLCDRVRHLIHGHRKHLVYRRYWRLDPARGAVQAHAVLAGIEDMED